MKSYHCLLLSLICIITLPAVEVTFNSNLKHYEVVKKSSFSHQIVKRGADYSENPFNHIRELNFDALGKKFKLILTQRKKLLSSKFKVVEVEDDMERIIHIDRDNWYEGRVFGETGSHASVHMEDGMLMGSIHTKGEVYHVEPAWRHLPEEDANSMIVYKDSNIDFHHQPSYPMCGEYFQSVEYNESMISISEERRKRSAYFDPIISDSKSPRFTRCSLKLVADYRFYKEMGGSSTKGTVNYLISLIDRVHKMFEDTEWSDGTDGFSGMGFSIKKILVHKSPTHVYPGGLHYNMAKSDWDVRQLLEVFSRQADHTDYCLAHLFTDTKFEGGILGLAYVGTPRTGGVGGICSPTYFKNGYTLYLNSGLSSSRNHYGQRVITREADLVTAHEFGHNWGSEHDPDIAECSPSASQGGSYLMYTYSVSGYDVNNKQFSPCSLKSIRKVLLSKSSLCFSEPEESFCGNLRVEGDEECDAGLLGSDNSDNCCDENCKLRPTAVCSDKNSPCCSLCQPAGAGVTCRTSNLATCEQEATCDGVSPICPPSVAMQDGTTCVDRGTCRLGQCVGFCESRGLLSCQCDDEKDACKRCCRSDNNSTCRAQLPVELLPDGTPCFQGLCDKGTCERTVQDVIRLWDIIDDISLSLVSKIFRDNLVMLIIIFSLLFWIPLSCYISHLDRKRAEADDEEWHWRRRGDLVHPRDNRRVIHVSVPRRRNRDSDHNSSLQDVAH